MPYEEITKEKYLELFKKIKPLPITIIELQEDSKPEKYCDNETCEIIPINTA